MSDTGAPVPSSGPAPAPGLDLFGQISQSLSADGKLPAVMADWIDLAADELTRGEGPMEPDTARRVAVRIVARLCREHGGTSPYIPKGDALERAIRDATLWADYDYTTDGPRGVRALARRENLTEVHVYRILDRQRELHRTRVQPRLPGV